jgi:hypothetical protein
MWRIASQAPTDRDRPELFPTGGPTELAAAKKFTAEHDAFWAASRKAHGDAAGTRALMEVLLLHRHLERVDVLAGITAAQSVSSSSPDVVALEARKAAERRGAAPVAGGADEGSQVVSLAAHRWAAMPADERPLPSVDKYDTLLGRETS